jgi:hypothetical protein
MRNTKSVQELRRFISKSAGKLRAFRAAAWPILILTALSCTSNEDIYIAITEISIEEPVCQGGICDADVIFPIESDENGYYHVPLDWSREYYPYFSVDIEAIPTSPSYYYGDSPVVKARFNSDTTWVIGDTLVVKQDYFNPFDSEWTSSNGPLPTYSENLDLTQFKGIVVNVAQNTTIYFSKKGPKMYSKRLLGPFPPYMKNDTITIYMEVMWDAGDNSVIKSDYLEKFIVE